MVTLNDAEAAVLVKYLRSGLAPLLNEDQAILHGAIEKLASCQNLEVLKAREPSGKGNLRKTGRIGNTVLDFDAEIEYLKELDGIRE